LSKFENQKNHNCKITTDQGNEYLVYANWMHNEEIDNFKNWKCDAGVTRISIDANLNVYSGECKNDYLGNAQSDFELNQQTVCKRERCTGCTDDLMVKKHI
jgi:hypothetical protein